MHTGNVTRDEQYPPKYPVVAIRPDPALLAENRPQPFPLLTVAIGAPGFLLVIVYFIGMTVWGWPDSSGSGCG